ncbi:MAG: flagellar filament capping protein FliD [Clostridiaceae bacterium]|nr:flagellar filament capping protein FliD [Clostridiaceae bacterium]
MSSVSSATSSQAASTKRYTGLSGMDTDSLVAAGLSGLEKKIDTTKQKKETMEIQQELYRGVMKDFQEFFDKYLDMKDSKNLVNSKNFTSISFSSADKSIATAISDSTVSDISKFKVKVEKLASSAKATLKLSDLENQNHLKISYLGKDIDIDITGCNTKDSITATINNKLKEYKMTAQYSEFEGGVVIKTDAVGKKIKVNGADYDNTFTINVNNHKAAKFTANSTDSEVKKKIFDVGELTDQNHLKISYLDKDIDVDITGINSNSQLATVINEKINGLGLIAQMTSEGKVSLEVNSVEDNIEIDGKRYANNFTISSGKYEAESNSASQNIEVEAGTNLHATITKTVNGYNKTITFGDDSNGKISTSNDVKLDGITFQFNDVGETTLNGEKDVSKIKEKIVTFVNDYNTLIEKMNTLLLEKRDRNYQPLTDKQKENMSEDQIKKWNAKVRTGQLSRDLDITSIVNKLKYAAQDAVASCGINLGNIGITLSKNYDKKAGTLKIDDKILEDALRNSTDEVSKLFTAYPSNAKNLSEREKYSQQGILKRMNDIINAVVISPFSPLLKKAGSDNFKNSDLTKSINSYEKTIKELKKEYNKKQQALYSKYARYESLLNKYNSQMSSLSQYFGSGQ